MKEKGQSAECTSATFAFSTSTHPAQAAQLTQSPRLVRCCMCSQYPWVDSDDGIERMLAALLRHCLVSKSPALIFRPLFLAASRPLPFGTINVGRAGARMQTDYVASSPHNQHKPTKYSLGRCFFPSRILYDFIRSSRLWGRKGGFKEIMDTQTGPRQPKIPE